MTLITCPQCHQEGVYMGGYNFDTYVCDCGCEFFCRNKDYVIGRNPFNGNMIKQHHNSVCPGCNKECECKIACSNACGTRICDCGQSFYVVNKQVISGHNPKCGRD